MLQFIANIFNDSSNVVRFHKETKMWQYRNKTTSVNIYYDYKYYYLPVILYSLVWSSFNCVREQAMPKLKPPCDWCPSGMVL